MPNLLKLLFGSRHDTYEGIPVRRYEGSDNVDDLWYRGAGLNAFKALKRNTFFVKDSDLKKYEQMKNDILQTVKPNQKQAIRGVLTAIEKNNVSGLSNAQKVPAIWKWYKMNPATEVVASQVTGADALNGWENVKEEITPIKNIQSPRAILPQLTITKLFGKQDGRLQRYIDYNAFQKAVKEHVKGIKDEGLIPQAWRQLVGNDQGIGKVSVDDALRRNLGIVDDRLETTAADPGSSTSKPDGEARRDLGEALQAAAEDAADAAGAPYSMEDEKGREYEKRETLTKIAGYVAQGERLENMERGERELGVREMMDIEESVRNSETDMDMKKELARVEAIWKRLQTANAVATAAAAVAAAAAEKAAAAAAAEEDAAAASAAAAAAEDAVAASAAAAAAEDAAAASAEKAAQEAVAKQAAAQETFNSEMKALFATVDNAAIQGWSPLLQEIEAKIGEAGDLDVKQHRNMLYRKSFKYVCVMTLHAFAEDPEFDPENLIALHELGKENGQADEVMFHRVMGVRNNFQEAIKYTDSFFSNLHTGGRTDTDGGKIQQLFNSSLAIFEEITGDGLIPPTEPLRRPRQAIRIYEYRKEPNENIASHFNMYSLETPQQRFFAIGQILRKDIDKKKKIQLFRMMLPTSTEGDMKEVYDAIPR